MGLGDKSIPVMGFTNLTILLGDEQFKREIYAEFVVVDISLSYNATVGQPILNNHGMITNMSYLCQTLCYWRHSSCKRELDIGSRMLQKVHKSDLLDFSIHRSFGET